jgi:TonB family protein
MRSVVISMCLLCGCTSGKEHRAPDVDEIVSSDSEVEKAEPEAPPVASPRTGPAADASAIDRRAAVLALLTDGESAAKLPVASTDEGKAFDAALVDSMAPRGAGSRVSIDPPVIEGSIDRDIVRRVLRHHVPALRGCYDRALAKKPGLTGNVALALDIDADGKVASVEVQQGTLGDADVERCMAELARKWEFPAPPDDKPAKAKARFVLDPGPSPK